VYPETVLTKENGRDYSNVNEAVVRLLSDALTELRAINPNIGIEFRQQYIGPVLRKFGNMFRAFDSPNDVVSNRIRTTDVKLLCGETAVHSDPQTWHGDEKVEIAALHVLNGLFAVPQMSMVLSELPEEHFSMIKFYTTYWRENKDILLNGKFEPILPLSNYPVLKSSTATHTILALYEDFIPSVSIYGQLDVINAKLSEQVVIRNLIGKNCKVIIYNCKGEIITEEIKELRAGLLEFNVPASGLIRIRTNQKN